MSKQKKTVIVNQQLKICPLCEKPHHSRTQLCGTCHSAKLKLCRQVGWKVSIAILLEVKRKYNPEELFSFFEQNYKRLGWSDHRTRLAKKREFREKLLSDFEKPFIKNYSKIPDYIKIYFDSHPTKQFLSIEGDKYNPLVIYRCIVCNREIAVCWSKIDKSHYCPSTKSSGELIVENYLKNFIKIKTQRETVRCVNPITGYPMPYDIEVPSKKLLIEIQGEQHLKFIPHFHATEEDFFYQQFKDKIKKQSAEALGYQLIYIYYSDIKSGKYKEILKKYIF